MRKTEEEEDKNRSAMSREKYISVKQLRTSFEAQSQNAAADSGKIISRISGRERLHKNFPGVGDSSNKEGTNLIDRHVSPDKHTFSDSNHMEKEWKEEAKGEMKMLFDDQKRKWKTTEDSIQELERRLTMLEFEKVKLQDSLLQKEAKLLSARNLESSHFKLEVDGMTADCPKGYPCIYVSPLFEEWKSNMDYYKRADLVSAGKRGRQERQKILVEGLGWEKSKDAQMSNLSAETGKLNPGGPKAEENSCKQLEQGNRKIQAFRCQISSRGDSICGSTELAEHTEQIDGGLFSQQAGNSLNLIQRLTIANTHIRDSRENNQALNNSVGSSEMVKWWSQLCEPQLVEHFSTSLVKCACGGNLQTLPLVNSHRYENVGDSEYMKYPITASDSANSSFVRRCDSSEEFPERDIPVFLKRSEIRNEKILEHGELAKSTDFEAAANVLGEQDMSSRVSVHEPKTCIVSSETLALKRAIEKLFCAYQEYDRKLQGDRAGRKTEEAKQLHSSTILQHMYADMLLEICRQLGDLGKELHSPSSDVDFLQKHFYDLRQVISKSGSKFVPLAKDSEKKEVLIEELKQRIQAIQDEKDAAALENIELMKRLHDLDKKSVEKSKHASELASMSRELLVLSQSEENELTHWHGKLTELQQVVEQRSLEIDKLAEELEDARRQFHEKEEQNQVLRILYASLEFKLDETEHELEQREATLERLALHMASKVEDEYPVSEETPPLWGSLRYFYQKDNLKEDQIRQSKIIIKTLEEHLAVMQEIVQKAKSEMHHVKAHNISTKTEASRFG